MSPWLCHHRSDADKFMCAAAVGALNATIASSTSSTAFNPYSSEAAFYLGAYIFEDVGVTAYKGAVQVLQVLLSALHCCSAYLTVEYDLLLTYVCSAVSSFCYSGSWHRGSGSRTCSCHSNPAISGIRRLIMRSAGPACLCWLPCWKSDLMLLSADKVITYWSLVI